MIHENEDRIVAISRVAETDIDENLRARLRSLLQASFPGYPDREYFKLPPHFRYLATADGVVVAAQVGVELRMIRVGDSPVRTFGVVDLCVDASMRSAGLASRLLAEVTAYAHACRMDFVVLMADDRRVYERNGWAPAANRCSWVKIHEHATLGLARQESQDYMMVKPIAGRAWPDGDVDLLGHMF